MSLITNKARAYVNHGRWIADCPIACGSALALTPRQTMYHCPECGHICEVEWTPDADEVWEALQKRPAKRFMNWFPRGHDLALRAHAPHGQSAAELEQETKEHME